MHTCICRALAGIIALGILAASGAVVRADEADDQFAVAAGNYDRQQWKLADVEFQAFLKKYPNDRRVNQCVFFLGEVQLQLGKLKEAQEQFKKYVSVEPNGKYARAALFRSSEAAYLASNYAEAKPGLESFLAKYPNDKLGAFVLPYLGDIALTNNDAKAAADYFRKGLSQFPDGRMQDDCRFGLGRALEKQNQAEEAERLYLAVAGKPGSALADAAQFHLGALQYSTGRYEPAIESFSAFETRLASSSWQPNARLGRGLCLLKLQKPDDAARQFDAVLAAPSAGDGLFAQALRGKIQAALQKKDYAGVDNLSAEFGKRFSKSPVLADVQRLVARSLVERKDFAKAASILEPLAAAKTPGAQDLENRYLLAISYEGLKRYEDALAALQPVVKDATGQLKSDALLTHGSLLLALKKYAEGISPLEAFFQSNPAGEAALKGAGALAVCYARTGQLDKAKKLYADFIAKQPQHPLAAPATALLAEAAYDANDVAWSNELSGRLATTGGSAEQQLTGKLGLAWSQFKVGKLAEAATLFDEVLQKNPPEAVAAEAALARGQILDQLGQSEPALSMYQQVIDKYPKSKQHADALLAAARLREKLKQPQNAVPLYERLAKDYPQFPKLDAVCYEWAWALLEMNKPDDANRLFERLHKDFLQSRFWADATCRLAQRALDAKDLDNATKLADEVLNRKEAVPGVSPQDAAKVREFALFLKGQVLAAKSDWPKVREAFESFLKEFSNTQRKLIAEFWIAEACYRQADYAAAGPRLERLAQQIKGQHEPWMAMILLRRAQLLAQQSQWRDAYEIVSKIAGDFPNFEQQYEVDYLIGRCLADQADFEGARQAYKRVIRSAAGAKTETAAMAQWMIGETYFHQKNYESALREYSALEILYAYPTWQAGALLQAGKCHELLGENREATLRYKRILKNYPQTTFVAEATQRLKKLETPPGTK